MASATSHLPFSRGSAPGWAVRSSPAQAPETIVETIVSALRLPFAAIVLAHDGRLETAATRGVDGPDRESWPLRFSDRELGYLIVRPRAAGDTLSRADRRLLDDFALQASAALHAVQLMTDLRRSRERVVAAREEERRRLRRDLHDELGPLVASRTLTLDAARAEMAANPQIAESLLDELRVQIQAAMADIRRLVYALRPPALDNLGLIGAVDEQLRPLRNAGVTARLDIGPLPIEIPAGVEAAAYRIVQEALTNVVRHADARGCLVRIALDPDGDALGVTVIDDGRGPAAGKAPGVGFGSMRERAAELGGVCAIDAAPGGGTRVVARLPLERR